MSFANEADLIAQCKQGDQAAMNRLFEQHYPRALKTARRIISSDADAEDMVQAAFCSALRHLDKFRGEASFSTWITRIIMNQCLMELRDPWRKNRQGELTPAGIAPAHEISSAFPSPDRYTHGREMLARMERAISRLPVHLRVAFGLYARSGLSLQEVASTLDLSLAAAKTRIFRARKLLKNSLPELSGISAHCCPIASASQRSN